MRAIFSCLKWAVFGFVGILTLWVLASFAWVRFHAPPESRLAQELGLSNEAAVKMASQSTRMLVYDARAVMAWLKGTGLFLTNEHVTDHICDETGKCVFEEIDKLDGSILPTPRELALRVCFPGKDICLMSAPGADLGAFALAKARVGEKVYYHDWEKDGAYLFEGKVKKIALDGDVYVDGYARNGLSGSPLFNRDGSIVGLIKQNGDGALILAPHRLLFGWAQGRSIVAVADPGHGWTSKTTRDLAVETFNEGMALVSHELQSESNRCQHNWASAVSVLKAIDLLNTLENYIEPDEYDQIESAMGLDRDIDEFCHSVASYQRRSI